MINFILIPIKGFISERELLGDIKLEDFYYSDLHIGYCYFLRKENCYVVNFTFTSLLVDFFNDESSNPVGDIYTIIAIQLDRTYKPFDVKLKLDNIYKNKIRLFNALAVYERQGDSYINLITDDLVTKVFNLKPFITTKVIYDLDRSRFLYKHLTLEDGTVDFKYKAII